jgi:bifunctional non-homologous end joining protein LigD
MTCMMLPTRFIEPCLPSTAERPPIGPNWIHEIKHDGYRLMARRNAAGVWLLTRNGHDWATRFPLIVQAVGALRLRSCLIDGEAVCCDKEGVPVFYKFRRRRDRHGFLYAFDLIELDGKDLRREPIEQRKAVLARLLRGAKLGLQLNEHLAEPGDVVFRHACRLGLEGIVSKRLGSRYVSGRSRDWLKFKNPQRAGSEAGSRGSLGVRSNDQLFLAKKRRKL